jgi:chaperonin cofactor prefoldin
MPGPLSSAIMLIFLAACSAAAQSPDTASPPPPAPAQDSTPPTDAPKPKKVWTNENLSGANGPVSVVGDLQGKPKPASSKANDQYVATLRKQIEKLQQQIADVDQQLVDLKNFSAGKPSTSAGGIKLNKGYHREPIEVQIRAFEEKRKDLQSRVDALFDEARKKGVEPGQLR